MTPKQLEFYNDLARNFERGIYPPLLGKSSYLFIYARELFRRWQEVGLARIAQQLLELAEMYSAHFDFAPVCSHWAGDCFLALGEYESFLDATVPPEPFGADTHNSNLRLNVQYHLGRDGDAVDLFRMAEGKVTSFTERHAGLFREILDSVFEEEADKKGRWLDRIVARLGESEPRYVHYPFAGVTSGPEVFGSKITCPGFEFRKYCFYAANKYSSKSKRFLYDFNDVIRACAREAENRLRDQVDIPRIGEGWVAESSLFHALAKTFSQTVVVHHGRPSWLGRQHFDVWFPRWKIAVEYHGAQHFEPVEFFGGDEAFAKTQERDERKSQLANENGVSLIVATEAMSHADVIAEVRSCRSHSDKES